MRFFKHQSRGSHPAPCRYPNRRLYVVDFGGFVNFICAPPDSDTAENAALRLGGVRASRRGIDAAIYAGPSLGNASGDNVCF